jgi:hypothetical protein
MVLKIFTSTRNTVINRVILGLVIIRTGSIGDGVGDIHQHQEYRDQQGLLGLVMVSTDSNGDGVEDIH